MAEGVTSFLDVTKRGAQYLFVLVNFRPIDVDEETTLDRTINQFGADLEKLGRVVRAHPHRFHETYNEVRAKAWPEELAAQMDSYADPFILVIDQDFAEFEPQHHSWVIRWFDRSPSFIPDLQDMFSVSARKLRDGENVISHLKAAVQFENVTPVGPITELEVEESDQLAEFSKGQGDPTPAPQAASTQPMAKKGGPRDDSADEIDLNKLINDAEVARLTSMSKPWVRQQRKKLRDGETHIFDVQPVMIGDSPRYRLADVLDWIKSQGQG